MFNKIKLYLSILLGNLIFAFSVSVFIIPNDFISSGVTGLALILEYFTKLNIEIGVTAINIFMLGIGALFLGKKFFITTIASTILYPVFFGMINRIALFQNISDDLLLNAICAGVLGGVGVGLVIKQGASTGGMDIPPLIINKFTGFSLSVLIYIVDVLVLCGQFFYASGEDILYGIIVVALFAIALDRVLLIGQKQIQLFIISPKYQEINAAISKEFDRGTTYIHVTTGYLNHEEKAVLSIINKRQLFRVNQIVRKIDPTIFMIANEVHEVRGRGFDLDKNYLND